MKMNVTATVSHALGHWPRILPALGIQVLKNRHQPVRSVAGVTVSVLMTGRGAAPGTAISVVPVTA